jgi:CRP-like cAMP-binding protein
VSARDEGAAGAGGALVNVGLRRLLFAFAALTLAEWAFVTALSIHAYRVGGTLAVGFVGFRFALGAVSTALLAPHVDRRPDVLSRIAVARTLLLGAAAVCVIGDVALAPVLVVVAIDAAASAPYRPAQARLLPALARAPSEVSAAAAGVSTVKTLSQALGALAGGLLVALVSPGAVMAGAAGAMVVAALLSHGLGGTRRAPGSSPALRAGLAAIPAVLRHREASPLVLAGGLRTLARGLWSALLVVVALQLLDLGSSGVGLLNAAVGAGAVAAVPMTAALIGPPRLGAPCALAFVAAGVLLIPVGVFDSAVVAVAVVACWGAAMAVADATSLSLLHRLLDAATVSRTVGVMESLKLATEGIGALLAPALVAVLGLRGALVVAGLPLALVVTASRRRLRRADAAAAGRGALARVLHGVPSLRSLDMASLEDVVARLHPEAAPAGADVVRQGEHGERFYVIESGEAEVLLDGYPIGRLGAGSEFGERALLRGSARTATVRAVTPLALQTLDRWDFLSAITGQPAEELAEAGAPLAAVRERDLSSRPLRDVLGRLTLFAGLDREHLEQLASAAAVERWPEGAIVVREGDEGTGFYVVLAGRAEASIAGSAVSELHPGDSFGEIALLHAVPRTATIRAIEALTNCRIAAADFLAATSQLSTEPERASDAPS